MTNSQVSNDWNPEEAAMKQQAQETETMRFVAKLSDGWQKEHEVEAKKIEEQLLHQYHQTSADETLLLRIAAHDVALTTTLGECELQISRRLRVMVDNAAVGLSLARTLRQVVVCRSAAVERVQQLFQTVGVLRGQRRISETPKLRRVS